MVKDPSLIVSIGDRVQSYSPAHQLYIFLMQILINLLPATAKEEHHCYDGQRLRPRSGVASGGSVLLE